MKKLILLYLLLNNFLLTSQVDTTKDYYIIENDNSIINFIYENLHWSSNLKGQTIVKNCIFIADIVNDTLIDNVIIIKGSNPNTDIQIAELLKRYKYNFKNINDTIKKVQITIPVFYSRK